MTGYDSQSIAAAILVGGFGLYLIGKGLSGNVPFRTDGKPITPRWMYLFSGLFMLILPIAFLVVLLLIQPASSGSCLRGRIPGGATRVMERNE